MAAAEAAQPGPSHLSLDRSRANLQFSSWRLSNTICRAQATAPLPALAAPAQASVTDYVVARHAALNNGLTAQPCCCYAWLEEGEGHGATQPQLALFQVEVREAGSPPQLRRVCGLPAAQDDPPAGSLPPSVVEVQTAAAPDVAGGDGAPCSLLLVSSGRGDVTLVARAPDAEQQPDGAAVAAATSAAVLPLWLPPPLQGARAVHLMAAFQLPGGASHASPGICCILWTPQPRTERQASQCQVYAVRLTAQLAAPPSLRVEAVQLLKVSGLPPHGVLVNPAAASVLLALQPLSGGVEEEAAAQRAAAVPRGIGAMADDDDDVSPRTLQAAAARLAAYTSEEPVGALPHQQYADLYREAGADSLGAMGSEPAAELYAFVPAGGPLAPAAGTAAEPAASPEQQPLLRLAHTLSCQPHKLLTCHLEPAGGGAQEPATPDTHLPQGRGGGRGPRLLLGLTDDVDCAVVAVSCRAGGGASGVCAADGGFVVEHLSSIPALAYVAAGKVQRKFLLLAPPGGDVACALVEAAQYSYLYRSVPPREQYGEHQVVDMELPDSSGRHGLLGAVLTGGRAGVSRLLLLAREGLRVMDL